MLLIPWKILLHKIVRQKNAGLKKINDFKIKFWIDISFRNQLKSMSFYININVFLSHQERIITFGGERVRIPSFRRLKALVEPFQSAQRWGSNSFTIESYDLFLMEQKIRSILNHWSYYKKIIDFNRFLKIRSIPKLILI